MVRTTVMRVRVRMRVRTRIRMTMVTMRRRRRIGRMRRARSHSQRMSKHALTILRRSRGSRARMIVHHRSGPFRTQDDLDAFLSVVVDVIDVNTINITIPFLAVAHFDLAETGFML